ncbi:MAG TPA: SDR family oxidoreductase [Thermoanaerobaculia bacterium]|jgi:NAD(P)-dependent dehydrogenase (short-subunit alcohol dehydrogenase family)
MKPLENSIALVAGATRGAGRGIARALGEAGATVYCTGRSSRETATTRPETIEETAELVTAAGGRGIAVRTDHTVESEVVALVERIRAESGRLDVLVNDIWGGDKLTQWRTPFWEVNIDDGRTLIDRAVMTHIITSRHAVPLMLASPPRETTPRLILEITDGSSWYYRGNLFYDLVKNAVIRLAYGMAWELRRKGIAAVAVTPGFLRSEEMLENFGVSEANWRDGAKVEPHFIASETPMFVGRAVAALAADPNVGKKSGRVFSSWELSDEYGFVDEDGATPHWGRYWEQTFGEPLRKMDEAFYAYGDGVIERVFQDWP